MILKNKCKESKIIVLISFILAIIFIIIGLVNFVSTKEKKLYSGKINSLERYKNVTTSAEKIMYKFSPDDSQICHFTVSSTKACTFYILEKNSKEDYANRKFLQTLYVNPTATTSAFLQSNETYYIYIVSAYSTETVISIQIS